MLETVKETLERLRKSLVGKAEQAYIDRDTGGNTSTEQAYAAGQGQAYGAASDEIRAAVADNDAAERQASEPGD